MALTAALQMTDGVASSLNPPHTQKQLTSEERCQDNRTNTTHVMLMRVPPIQGLGQDIWSLFFCFPLKKLLCQQHIIVFNVSFPVSLHLSLPPLNLSTLSYVPVSQVWSWRPWPYPGCPTRCVASWRLRIPSPNGRWPTSAATWLCTPWRTPSSTSAPSSTPSSTTCHPASSEMYSSRCCAAASPLSTSTNAPCGPRRRSRPALGALWCLCGAARPGAPHRAGSSSRLKRQTLSSFRQTRAPNTQRILCAWQTCHLLILHG